MENLQEAFLRAARGKSSKREVADFRRHLSQNLHDLHHQLAEGTYRLSSYHYFTIHDPKERTICAASFRDRVAFQSMMLSCHQTFESFQIFDSYASRIGKGSYKALDRAKEFASKYTWYGKLDVRKFFDSIHHEVLTRQLCRLFKDRQLLLYFRDIIDSYETTDGRGLPIGNLTSQYFANHYLAVADHWAKEKLHVPAMVRYMDDVLLFSNDLKLLKSIIKDYVTYVNDTLKLTLHLPIINRCSYGIPFLGYVVYPHCLRLNQRSRKRFRVKMQKLTSQLEEGSISQGEYVDRATCLLAFIQKADASDFIYTVANTKGLYPYGL